jgi:RNA-directed DNA polymerase
VIDESLEIPDKVRELQIKLYRKAKNEPGFRFYQLYDKVYREDILLRAWVLAKANDGSPGRDDESFEDIESTGLMKWLNDLRKDLHDKTYRPQPVKRVMVEKSGGGERPLGIPTIRDRVAQTAAKLVLEPIFEADLEPNAYGYRPRRSAQDAIRKVDELLYQGYTDIVGADLSKYFDTIPHSELLQCVARRVVDKHMLHLLKMWLKVPVEERDEKGKKRLTGGKDQDRGTPQGGVLTPRTQKITSNLSGGCGSGRSRVRIDVCRTRLYVYDRCREPAMSRRPSASIAHGPYFGKSINFPMRSSGWRRTALFRRVKPTVTSNKPSN